MLREDLRPTDDIAALCRATGVFSDAEIAIAEELATDRRTRGEASDYRFLLADGPDGLAGYACFGPTPCTLSAWDLYWIVVHPRAQGQGLGRALVAAVLSAVRQAGGLRLYAETAGKPLYAPTRAFYAAAGFTLQAVVPDFYAPGDAKQIWLRLAG
jgi:GNAT superfamily N-acetyltransferase